MDRQHLGNQQLQGRQRTRLGRERPLAEPRQQPAELVGPANAGDQLPLAERRAGQVGQGPPHALELRPDERDLARRRGRPAGQRHARLAGLGGPAVWDLPPQDRMPQGFEALGDRGEVVARGAHAARQQVGDREVRGGDERPEHRPDGAERLVDAERIGHAQQPGALLHHAGDPPRSVRVERHHVRQRVGHHGHRAEVLHRADDLPPAGPRLVEAVLLGQEEVPQAKGGGGVVVQELRQSPVAVGDVPPQRAPVARLAEPPRAQGLVATVPLLQGDSPRRRAHDRASSMAWTLVAQRSGTPASVPMSSSKTGTSRRSLSRHSSAFQVSHHG